MLDKKVLIEFLNNKEYIKIIDYFSDEYKELLKNLLLKNNIEFNDNATINELFIIVEKEFPRFYGVIHIIKKSLYDEDITIQESLDNLISNYNYIKNELT